MAEFDSSGLWKALTEIIPDELGRRHGQFVGYRLSALGIACDPKAGQLQLCARVEGDLAKKEDMANWRFANFTADDPTENWRRLRGPLFEMREFWKAAERCDECEPLLDSILSCCAAAITDERVRQQVDAYDITEDFEFIVPNPANPYQPNCCSTYGARHRKPPAIELKYRSRKSRILSVSEAWTRLQGWFETHLPHVRLSDPASKQSIRSFEKALGCSLPEDVRESYFIHDGADQLVYGLELMPIEMVVNAWQRWSEYADSVDDHTARRCDSFPSGMVRRAYCNSRWIPLTSDAGGNYIAVDLAPDHRGVSGQVIIFGRDDTLHPVLALSWAQFLSDLAVELEQGNFRIDGEARDVAHLLANPSVKHFHSAGIDWSRRKLGRRKLAKADQEIWDRRRGSG